MKFNNKLNLIDYLQIVKDISNNFFDDEHYEYIPQIGEIYAMCAYFNYCVELEDTDEINIQPIEDIMDMQLLFDNKEFIENYNKEIWQSPMTSELIFSNAYIMAKEIVKHRLNDANAFAEAITSGMVGILKAFRESFSDEEIKKLTDVTTQIVNGKIDNDSIVKAYENSDRFKMNTDDVVNSKGN